MKKILLISTLLLIFTLVLNPVFASTSKIIIIDAGHGGSDPGTTQCRYDLIDGNMEYNENGQYTYTEADANFDIALLLKEELKDKYTVFITRDQNDDEVDDDVTLSNEDRYNYANDNLGDALISIHLNGSETHSKNGTMGLYAKIKKDKAFTQTLHDSLVSAFSDDNPEVPDEGITNFMSGVTMRSEMPATIQEAVYLSNSDECQMFLESKNNGSMERQRKIAKALFEGIEEWFSDPVEWVPPGISKRSM